MVSALCAPAMLLSESAVETLERNSPSGLFESAFEGASFSTSARYVLASVESPDLMADIRLVSALSNEFALLPEELEVDDVEDEASSVKRLDVLCKLEISMNCDPFPIDFSGIQLLESSGSPSYLRGLQSSAQRGQSAASKEQAVPIKESEAKAVRKWEAYISRARSMARIIACALLSAS